MRTTFSNDLLSFNVMLELKVHSIDEARKIGNLIFKPQGFYKFHHFLTAATYLNYSIRCVMLRSRFELPLNYRLKMYSSNIEQIFLPKLR